MVQKEKSSIKEKSHMDQLPPLLPLLLGEWGGFFDLKSGCARKNSKK